MNELSNLDKARKIVKMIIEKDYSGDLKAFQDENGDNEGVIQDVYFWLEDGHGDGQSIDVCRLMFEL